jgi:hypothetical protein
MHTTINKTMRDLINIIIPWSDAYLKSIRASTEEELDERPMVAVIPPQPPGLTRCTAVSCNAILEYYGRKLITSAAEVPQDAESSWELLKSRGLKVQPDIGLSEKGVTVQNFVNTHQSGVWYIGTLHHALAVIDGELFDTEHKGLDARIVDVVASIVQ